MTCDNGRPPGRALGQVCEILVVIVHVIFWPDVNVKLLTDTALLSDYGRASHESAITMPQFSIEPC